LFLKVADALERGVSSSVDVSVVGAIYPPSQMATYAASTLQWIFFGGLILLFGGEFIMNALNFAPGRSIVNFLKNNQGMAIFAFFMCNQLASQMLSTGAFEVFFNDKLVFSKLQSGDLPNVNQLMALARDPAGLAALPANAY